MVGDFNIAWRTGITTLPSGRRIYGSGRRAARAFCGRGISDRLHVSSVSSSPNGEHWSCVGYAAAPGNATGLADRSHLPQDDLIACSTAAASTKWSAATPNQRPCPWW